MTTISKPIRLTAAGLLAAGLILAPAAAAAASPARVSFADPGHDEWWFAEWQVQREVWPLTQGAGVTVAVLDTGVQASVPDLRGVVLSGADMTGAGDPHGQVDINSGSGSDGHGTGVSALIAGQGYGTGTVGIAPLAKILPVSVLTGLTSPFAGMLGGAGQVAAGIRFAVDHGAQVINMSFGWATASAASCDPQLQDAVAYALEHNVVLVAASGDTGKTGPDPVQPASCAGVLAVGGVEPEGSLWAGSTRQPYVAVAAPGDQIPWSGSDGRLTEVAGTSASAPLVAAAAALIRSRYPSMPWYQVDQRITGTAIPEGNPVPNDGYGYGILDLARAVNASAYPVPSSAPNPVYAKYSAWLASPQGRLHGATPPPPAQAAHTGIPGPLLLGAVVGVILLAALILAVLTRIHRPGSYER